LALADWKIPGDEVVEGQTASLFFPLVTQLTATRPMVSATREAGQEFPVPRTLRTTSPQDTPSLPFREGDERCSSRGRRKSMTTEASNTQDLKAKLSQHIDTARAKLDALKADIATIHEEDVEALRTKRAELDKRLAEQKEKARKLQADIASWQKEKVAHTQEAVGAWRKRREVQKLESRAERAEEYAVDMVMVAAYDFEEAERALFDAVAARYDADLTASAP
jgi:hypothetical protein